MPTNTGPRERGDLLRRYTPLLGMAAALLLVVTVLPSALNLRQSNPTTTPEYAPVPPSGDSAAPPGGNLSSLGLAGSASLKAGTASTPTSAPSDAPVNASAGPASGKTPRTKRCIGSPPRQTEDPLSPPCVSDFRGNNGGATYRGVTTNEVKVLVYFTLSAGGAENGSSKGNEPTPVNRYDDFAEPQKSDEFIYSRMLRLYQQSFNDRYQTYNRFVHFVVHYGAPDPSAETRRSDAAEDASGVQPFLVLNFATKNADAYTSAMAQRGIVVIVGRVGGIGAVGFENSFFSHFPSLLWSYLPSIEQRARLFTTWACTKAVPYPVSFSGNPVDMTAPRVFGLVGTNDTTRADLTAYTNRVRAGMEACGVQFKRTAIVDRANPQSAVVDMADFRQQGVTSIVWVGGEALEYTNAAANVQYRPEWLLPGDLAVDTNFQGRLYDPTEWSHARTVTTYTRVDAPVARPCFAAAREVDPSAPQQDITTYACEFYPYVQQLFTGVQVAGPKLSPSSMDAGFHAIPAIASKDPSVPACFYASDDYTCVKDAQATWWDPTGQAPGASSKGCWRMMEAGLRHLAAGWPGGDVDAQRRADDACNAQGPDL
jgi:hypothetical protein